MILLGPGRLDCEEKEHRKMSRLVPRSKAKRCIVKLVAAM